MRGQALLVCAGCWFLATTAGADERTARCLSAAVGDAPNERFHDFVQPGRAVQHTVRLTDRCATFVAVGADRFADVDLEIHRPSGETVALDERAHPEGWVTYCGEPAERLHLVVRSSRRNEVEVWHLTGVRERPNLERDVGLCFALAPGPSTSSRTEIGPSPPRPLDTRAALTVERLEAEGWTVRELPAGTRSGQWDVPLQPDTCYQVVVLSEGPVDARWLDADGTELLHDRRGRSEATMQGCPESSLATTVAVSGRSDASGAPLPVHVLLAETNVGAAGDGLRGDGRLGFVVARESGARRLVRRAWLTVGDRLAVPLGAAMPGACEVFVAVAARRETRLRLATYRNGVRHSWGQGRGSARVFVCGARSHVELRSDAPGEVQLWTGAPSP